MKQTFFLCSLLFFSLVCCGEYPEDFLGPRLSDFHFYKVGAIQYDSTQSRLTDAEIKQGVEANDPFCLYLLAVEKLSYFKTHEEGLALLNRSAKQGFAPAMAYRGALAEEGLKRFRKTDNPKKAYKLGEERYISDETVYEQDGYYLKQDFSEAARYYQQAADAGCAEARFRLGLLYLNGLGVEKDEQKADNLINQAKNEGDYFALHTAAQRNLAKSAASVAQANPDALCRLATLQWQNYTKAWRNQYPRKPLKRDETFVVSMERSAQAGSPRGQYLFGLILADFPLNRTGTITEPDGTKKECCEFDYPFFVFALQIYNNQNSREALEWVSRSADQGYAPAITARGVFLLNGLGVEGGKSKPEEGFKELVQAAEKEDPNAAKIVGICQALGIGTVQDEQAAFETLKKNELVDKKVELYQLIARLYKNQFGSSISYNALKPGDSRSYAYWLKKVYDSGGELESDMQEELAIALLTGVQIPQDETLAYKLIMSRNNSNFISNDYPLFLRAMCLNQGWGVEKNEVKAKELLQIVKQKLAKENESGKSADKIEDDFFSGIANICLLRKEPQEAGRLWLQTKCLKYHAICHATGWGTPKNEAKAKELARKCILREIAEDAANDQEKIDIISDADIYRFLSRSLIDGEFSSFIETIPYLKDLLDDWAKRSQAREKRPTTGFQIEFPPVNSHRNPYPWLFYDIFNHSGNPQLIIGGDRQEIL